MSKEIKYDIVKFVDDEIELEVNVSPKEETTNQMVILFKKDEKTILKKGN